MWRVTDTSGCHELLVFRIDICDDLILREVNESDASAFARQVGCCPSQVCGDVWFLISCAFFVGGILCPLTACVQSQYRPFCDARFGTKGHDIMHVST